MRLIGRRCPAARTAAASSAAALASTPITSSGRRHDSDSATDVPPVPQPKSRLHDTALQQWDHPPQVAVDATQLTRDERVGGVPARRGEALGGGRIVNILAGRTGTDQPLEARPVRLAQYRYAAHRLNRS